jgi:hypothetical protein
MWQSGGHIQEAQSWTQRNLKSCKTHHPNYMFTYMHSKGSIFQISKYCNFRLEIWQTTNHSKFNIIYTLLLLLLLLLQVPCYLDGALLSWHSSSTLYMLKLWILQISYNFSEMVLNFPNSRILWATQYPPHTHTHTHTRTHTLLFSAAGTFKIGI